MSDQILEGLERDFCLTDFLFFQSTQDNSGYHHLIADFQVSVNSPSFKMNCGKRNKSPRANVTSKLQKKNKMFYHRELCKKSGYTAGCCYKNPESKKYKGGKDGKDFEKPNIQLHTSVVPNRGLKGLAEQALVDSEATDHFFCNPEIFEGEIRPHSSLLECASGNISIKGTGTVRLDTTEAIMTSNNVRYVPELTVNLLSFIKFEKKGFDNLLKMALDPSN